MLSRDFWNDDNEDFGPNGACQDWWLKLSAYSDGELSANEAAEVSNHVSRCAACKDELEFLQSASAAASALPPVAPPSDLRDRILSKTTRKPSLWKRVATAPAFKPAAIGAAGLAALAVFAISANNGPQPSRLAVQPQLNVETPSQLPAPTEPAPSVAETSEPALLAETPDVSVEPKPAAVRTARVERPVVRIAATPRAAENPARLETKPAPSRTASTSVSRDTTVAWNPVPRYKPLPEAEVAVNSPSPSPAVETSAPSETAPAAVASSDTSNSSPVLTEDGLNRLREAEEETRKWGGYKFKSGREMANGRGGVSIVRARF